MTGITFRTIDYDPADLEAWKSGRYQILKRSRASQFIKGILCEKARHRRAGRLASGKEGDRRFFGEAAVAAHPDFAHREGWYGSFKWLSAPVWREPGKSSSPSYRGDFQAALHAHVHNLDAVQSHEARLRLLLKGKHAVAPDLWLFDGRKHRFIEVKLRGDCVRDPQLAGLALIAGCLRATPPVSVEVVALVPRGSPHGALTGDERVRFRRFLEAAA